MHPIDVNLMKTLTWHDFGKIVSDDPWLHDPDIRLVHLSDSKYRPSISDFEQVLCGENRVKDVLTKSQYLFGLIVHAAGTIDESSLNDFQTVIRGVFIDSGKYFFIEFYSDYDSDTFVDNVRYVFNQQKVTKYRQRRDNSVSSISKENDELWLNVFDKSLLKFYFLNEKICEECIKKAVDDGDCLSVRILKLFNTKVKISSEKKILERLVTKNHEVVRAFLNLPIVEGNNVNSISPTPLTERTKIFEYKFNGVDFECNRSLLCVAVQGNELDVVKLLLRLGFDINQVIEEKGESVIKEKTVTDYCQNPEILKFFLNNDAKFPVNFSDKFESLRHCSGSQKDIFDIAVDRLELHAAIENKNTEAILTFRKKYPNLRMAYMHMDTAPYNRSATMTFIKHTLQSTDQDFRFYANLFSYGFRDDHQEIADLRMATGKQEKISKTLLNKLLHDQSDHIGYLRNKTKIGTVVHHATDNNDYQKRVDKIYERIKDIGGAEVNNVLKVLQHSQSLTIVIDFHSKYVNPMCPLMNKETDGITYQNEGHIYVGAGGKTEIQIAATLVHELCHFAIHITFDNACNPYYTNDHVNANKMLNIVKQISECRQQIQIECGNDVITSVFDYDETDRPRELIVRLPEMIMMEKRHLLDDDKYKILVDYFEKQVLSTIKTIIEESEDFRLRRDVEQLNGYLGIVERIKCSKNEGIWPNKKRLPEISNSCSLVCSIPNLLLADVYDNLVGPTLSSTRPVNEQARNNYYILASIGDFDSPTKKRRIFLAWTSTIDVTLILNCENYKKSFLQHSDFFEELNKSRKIILIGSNEKILLEIAPNSSLYRIQYDWTDIAEEQIEILFQKEINFQGVNVALNTLIGNDCDVIALEKLINDSQIKVETFKVSIDNYDESQYVDRRFQTYENVDDLLSDASNERKTLLLSDVSGSGKSIIFSRICKKIKEKRQYYWVSRINLHEWGETFQCVDTSDPVTQLTNILVKTVVKMDKEFQEKLFEKLYQNSRVILLFDAYDELPSQYRKDFQNLVEKLNKNIQIWISTRPQFETRLHSLLNENLVPFKLMKFSYDDIYDCITKFWQNFIQKSEAESKSENLFDDIRSGANFLLSNYIQEPAVKSKLKRYAVEMISLLTDSVKKFVMEDTFLQPSIVIILAEYYQQYVKDFIFNESEHFTIDSYIDIFDLYKLIVTKKYMNLYRQKGLGIAVETAEDLIFQDVGGYLEHMALKSKFGPKVVDYYDYFIVSKYEYCDTVETDDESMVGRLQRSGLISFSDDLSDNPVYFIDDSVCDYFVAAFVIKKLRRATSAAPSIDQSGFDAAMKILCINIIEPARDDLTLLTFIDEGIKRFWDLFSDRVFVVCNTYFNKTPEITFNYDSFAYLLRKNAIFLLNYFIECFTASTSTKFEISKLEGLLKIASGIGVFSVVDMFWYHKEMRKLVTSEHIRDAFRAAFVFFPESKVAVLRDNMNFREIKDAFGQPSEFNKSLQKMIEENFNNSTLYNLVSMCPPIQDTSELVNKRRDRHLVRRRAIINGRVLNPKSELVPCPTLSQDHLNELIKFEEYNCDAYDCDIKIDFFEAYIEMKWMVLEELKHPASCWKDVVNQTLFGTLVAKIFDNFDNILVLKFYEWAYSKEKLKDSFKHFVEDTIVRHFYRCELKPGVDELFQFIRQTLAIDIETVFQRHGLSEWGGTARFLPICMKFFTKDEFTAFLTASYDGDDNVLVSTLKSKSSDLVDFVLAIHHFQNSDVDIMDTIKNTCNTIKSDDDDMLKTINKSIIKTLSARISDGQGKIAFNLLMNFTKNLFRDSVIRDALRSHIRYFTLEYTIFHDACGYNDMDVMNGVWYIAKQHLTVDEWRELLMFTNDRVKNTIIKENDSRFIDNPPTLYNTFCAASAYQFIPFDRCNIKIPDYAVGFKGVTDRSTFIGRLSNNNGDQLCQICFDGTELTEIKPIPDDANIDLNGNEFEILTVKGVEWSHFKTKGFRFQYKNLALWANEHGLITLEDKFERRNNGYDLIFNSSFNDNLENENIIYYKYEKY